MIIEIGEACKYVKQDWREDVFQEMVTSCLEGRLHRKNIKRAVPTFITFAMRRFSWANSYELPWSDFFAEDTNNARFWDRMPGLAQFPEAWAEDENETSSEMAQLIGWLPIETAPKTAPVVLVWDQRFVEYPVAVFWHTSPRKANTRKSDEGEGCWRCVESELENIVAACLGKLEPTHWLPWVPPTVVGGVGIEPTTSTV